MNTRTGEIFRLDEPMTREKSRRMERADARGELVQVSAKVARLMEMAQAEERRQKRQAAKQARKKESC
jgi:hypothetical protein